MTAPAVSLTVPSLLVLGTDTVLAAAPATPVQLAHACLASGFQAVIPASWGDELIAARALERLRDIDAPRVQCSCPHVSKRLAEHGEAIAPQLLHFVPPPIATAQYLRAVYAPVRPHITYAGGCPAAADEAIDAWLSVAGLMDMLIERGFPVLEQPTEFDSVLPPDRRRHFSEPGGIPSRLALRKLTTPVDLVELRGADVVVDLAQHLLSTSFTLIDASLSLGCFCSGATGDVSAEAARARVREQEPPRAPSPIVDHSMPLVIDAIVHAPSTSPKPPGLRPITAQTTETVPEGVPAAVDTMARRRSPPGISRPGFGATPVRRSDAGRQLPRAFVARRRSSPRSGMRQALIRSRVSSPFAGRPPWVWMAAASVAVLGLALLFRFVL